MELPMVGHVGMQARAGKDTRMNRMPWVAIIIAGWLIGAGAPAQAIVLRYAPSVGTTATQRMFVAAAYTYETKGMPEAMTARMTSLMTVAGKVLSVDAEGTKVESTITDGKLTVETGGRTFTQKMPAGRVVLLTDPLGQSTKLLSSDFQSASGGPVFDPQTFSLSASGGFPEADVKVGDTWDGEISIAASGIMPAAKLKATSQLLELTTYKGRKCAKIRTGAEGPLKADLAEIARATGGQATQGTMSGTIQGEETWYYDYEAGVRVGSTATYTATMEISSTNASGSAETMTMQAKINAKMALVK